MTIPYFKRTEESYVRRIEPRQPKSFRSIIEEASRRMACMGLIDFSDPSVLDEEYRVLPPPDEPDWDEIAREAVESSNHQRHGANRF